MIAPEFNDMVTITDKDLKVALRFLILSATIMEEMQLDLIARPYEKPDYAIYSRRIAKYEPTLEGMLADFEDNIFGYFYNRRTIESFIDHLKEEGWKYFSVQNLNEMFSIMVTKYGTCDPDEKPAKPAPSKEKSQRTSEKKTEKKLAKGSIVVEKSD